MDDFTFVTANGELTPEDKQIMADGMLAYHASKGHPRKTENYSTVVKDKEGKTIGLSVVSFLWNGMEINTLWVDESFRCRGLGRRLMEIVEAEGLKRGCAIAYTNTFSWQAPEFYSKLGYTLYGKLDNFPEGCSLSYYYKSLKNS